jgi:hypothetical protein
VSELPERWAGHRGGSRGADKGHGHTERHAVGGAVVEKDDAAALDLPPVERG